MPRTETGLTTLLIQELCWFPTWPRRLRLFRVQSPSVAVKDQGLPAVILWRCILSYRLCPHGYISILRQTIGGSYRPKIGDTPGAGESWCFKERGERLHL